MRRFVRDIPAQAGLRALPGEEPRQRAARAALVAAVVLGVIVRAYHVLRWSFPLNDGGLFFAMVRDLQAADYRLPQVTTYNGEGITYGYSPFAFYVAGLVDDLTPLGLFDVFRLLPLLFTCGTLVVFVVLARRFHASPVALVSSIVAFAFIPRTFIWLLMGGGLTRSLGLVCALGALACVQPLYARGDRRWLLPATLLSVATVLAHLETGWFLAFSIALFFLAFGRTGRSAWHSAVLAGATLALTAPWWGTVLAREGLEPFLAATSSSHSAWSSWEAARGVLLSIVRITATSEPFFPLAGTIALVVALRALAMGRYLLPVCLTAIFLL
ncbi:MAG: hypothetical protein ACR2HN_02650, partial [Tepidiformaceae bacterium]